MLKKSDIISVALCLCGIIPGAVVYDDLPARITTNWSMNNTANSDSPKAFVVFGFPLIFAAVLLAGLIYGRWLEKKDKAGRLIPVIRIVLPAVTLICELTMILAALGKIKDVRYISCLLVSVMMIIVGNYLPKMRHNWIFGIRTPHIVKNEKIWYKTHRLAAFTVTLGGVAGLVTTLMDYFVAAFVIIIASVLIPTIYGEVIYYMGKKEG